MRGNILACILLGLIYFWMTGAVARQPLIKQIQSPLEVAVKQTVTTTAAPLSGKLSIKEQIRILEPELADLLIRLAECESNLRPDVRGVIDKRDRGLFQINSRWHPEISDECAFDIECSTKFTANAIRNGNINWWVCAYKIN